MFDSCVNLHSEQFKNDYQSVIQSAFQEGLTGMSLTGSCLESSKLAIELANANPEQLCATVGIHPHSAKDFSKSLWAEMSQLAQMPNAKAIGECGLDYFRNLSTPSDQRSCFEAHLTLADTLKKPLFLHQRDAYNDFVEILDSFNTTVPIVVHCFTDGLKEIKGFLDRGYLIGITGWVADSRRNEPLLEAIKYLPLERLLIETDAPWLLPRNIPRFRKIKRNEPRYLSYVVQAISEATGHDQHRIIEHSTRNARQFFGWEP